MKKMIYDAPQVMIDEYKNLNLICVSNNATNESFSDEIDIQW